MKLRVVVRDEGGKVRFVDAHVEVEGRFFCVNGVTERGAPASLTAAQASRVLRLIETSGRLARLLKGEDA